MHFHLVSAGKTEPSLLQLINDYERRLSGNHKISWHITKTSDKETENNYFQQQLEKKSFIALDESGLDVSSKDISQYLHDSAVDGRSEMYFLIGGSYGIEQRLLDNAESTWRFGSITLPHQLARLLLVEQLYRAHSINTGGKYHHA